ncbi:MAG: hypothetical protein OHK0028_18150 [Deltaproteobacteria bacterium]
MRKDVSVAALFLLIAVVPLAVFSAEGDKAASLPAENSSSPSGNSSYFEGVWVGSWPGFRSASFSQDVTIKIDRGAKEGVFPVEYSWGGGPPGSGFPRLPGSVKTKGKEEGGQFVFGWTNKVGRKVTITLKKQEGNKVKAMLEKSGPSDPNERPFNETTLKRK